MDINGLWDVFARTGNVSDYLNYRNAVNKRVEGNANKYGRNYSQRTECWGEGQARDGADASERAY